MVGIDVFPWGGGGGKLEFLRGTFIIIILFIHARSLHRFQRLVVVLRKKAHTSAGKSPSYDI